MTAKQLEKEMAQTMKELERIAADKADEANAWATVVRDARAGKWAVGALGKLLAVTGEAKGSKGVRR